MESPFIAYRVHLKKFDTRTYVCPQSNRDRPESFLRSLHFPSVPRYTSLCPRTWQPVPVFRNHFSRSCAWIVFCFIQINESDHGFYHRWYQKIVSYNFTLIEILSNFSSTKMSFCFSLSGRITESRSIKVNVNLEFLHTGISMTLIYGSALFSYNFPCGFVGTSSATFFSSAASHASFSTTASFLYFRNGAHDRHRASSEEK